MNNELIIEDKKGHRKLITLNKFFFGWDDAEQWVSKKYRGHKLVGIQEGLFGEVKAPNSER